MPQRSKPTNLNAASHYPFLKQVGVLNTDAIDRIGHDRDNNSPISFSTADGVYSASALNYDASNRIVLGTSVVRSTPKIVRFNMNLNAGLADQAVWISDGIYEVTGAFEVHSVAGSDSAAVTIDVTKDISGVAPGAGISVLAAPFNAKATANTVQGALPATVQSTVMLAVGDRLSLNFTGTLTALVGVVVEVIMSPGYSGDHAIFAMNANTGLVDQCFYTATKNMQITGISYVHSTLGTNGSDVNVQVTKDVSTNAPGAGTDLLTNNTNAGFNCKAAINVVQTGTLSATAANLRLAPGDRLSVDFSGTLTALAGVLIVVYFTPYYQTFDVRWNLSANADQADQCIFIANRPFKIRSAYQVHSVAAGATANAQITIDRGTDAPGAGTDLLSNDTNAGFNLNATANTPQIATFIADGSTYLLAGDRLSLDYSGTLTSLAGMEVTITLEEA